MRHGQSGISGRNAAILVGRLVANSDSVAVLVLLNLADVRGESFVIIISS